MIVLLPVCEKDKDAALRNLAWALSLDGGKVPFTAIVSYERGFDASRVIKAAQEYFGSVLENVYAPYHSNPAWPGPQNWAWRQAASFIFCQVAQSWFWWEQDAVPLRKGWLGAIRDAYASSGKQFMGATGVSEWGRHLNGVAVYPPDVLVRYPELGRAAAGPFDVVGGKQVLDNALVSPLFQHVWTDDGTANGHPMVFNSQRSLSKLSPEAVLFHRCKDGSLVNSLKSISNGKRPWWKRIIPKTVVADSGLDPITVVITNYKRPEMLKAAFESCAAVGIRNVVVSSSGADSAILRLHREFQRRRGMCVRVSSISSDKGCNETWLRGVRMVGTPWVHILHDDDLIRPEFANLRHVIKLPEVCFAHWNGSKHGSTASGIYNTFPGKPSGVYPTDILWPFLFSCPNTISPVSGLFPREHLISVLDECERNFTSNIHFYRKNMMVGNDLMIWLRATENYPRFYYSAEPLISYGHWEGSCSYEDSKNGFANLPRIYSSARNYYLSGPDFDDPKSKKFVHVKTAFGSGSPNVDNASGIWEEQYRQADWTLRTIRDEDLPRLFQDDKRQVPFLKDMISKALESLDGNPVVVLTNSDIVPIDSLTRHMVACFRDHDCAYSYRRDIAYFRRLSEKQIRLETQTYAGIDLFAFTRSWWEQHASEYPDMLFATDIWDYCLKKLMDCYKARRFHYLIYHVQHSRVGAVNRNTLSERHNREEGSAFLRKLGVVPYWESPTPVNMNPR